jgi:hypothetical protein
MLARVLPDPRVPYHGRTGEVVLVHPTGPFPVLVRFGGGACCLYRPAEVEMGDAPAEAPALSSADRDDANGEAAR